MMMLKTKNSDSNPEDTAKMFSSQWLKIFGTKEIKISANLAHLVI